MWCFFVSETALEGKLRQRPMAARCFTGAVSTFIANPVFFMVYQLYVEINSTPSVFYRFNKKKLKKEKEKRLLTKLRRGN